MPTGWVPPFMPYQRFKWLLIELASRLQKAQWLSWPLVSLCLTMTHYVCQFGFPGPYSEATSAQPQKHTAERGIRTWNTGAFCLRDARKGWLLCQTLGINHSWAKVWCLAMMYYVEMYFTHLHRIAFEYEEWSIQSFLVSRGCAAIERIYLCIILKEEFKQVCRRCVKIQK